LNHLFLTSLYDLYKQYDHILLPIFIGCAAGLLAQMLLPGRGYGLLGSFVIGMAGAWLGNRYVISYLDILEHELVRKIVSATIGAMALSFVLNIFSLFHKKDRDKTKWRNN
jgi:uncharacterized membrane protein YeaQ/YmgE (transglycosylase-associated protein family)